MVRLSLLIALLLPAAASAQSFVAPIDGFGAQRPAVATLLDGTVLEGTIPSSMGTNGGLVSFTIKDAAGEKHRLKADEVAELRYEPNQLQRLAATSEIADSKWEALRNLDKFAEVMATKEVIYKRAKMPPRGREKLVQLLNPGFSSVMEVFVDSTDDGNEVMGMAVTLSSYLVSVRGEQAIQVKKVKYKKVFPELFAGCEQVLSMENPKKPDFDHFAAHVMAYEAYCSE